MARRRKRQAKHLTTLEAWRDWQEHGGAPDYFTRTGRISPVLHTQYALILIVIGGLCLVLSFALLLMGKLDFSMLIAGMVFTALGIVLLRWNKRRIRRNGTPNPPRQRRRASRR